MLLRHPSRLLLRPIVTSNNNVTRSQSCYNPRVCLAKWWDHLGGTYRPMTEYLASKKNKGQVSHYWNRFMYLLPKPSLLTSCWHPLPPPTIYVVIGRLFTSPEKEGLYRFDKIIINISWDHIYYSPQFPFSLLLFSSFPFAILFHSSFLKFISSLVINKRLVPEK